VIPLDEIWKQVQKLFVLVLVLLIQVDCLLLLVEGEGLRNFQRFLHNEPL